MYSPTTRLLTVLELLQSHQRISGPEIARRLEVDIRTVRRYIVMLQDMGIPVEAERGPYGTYQLQRGHRLPPLIFTDAEVVALTLGLLAIREFRFPIDVAAVESALAKTERVLPERLLERARALQEAITFNVQASFNLTPPPDLLQNEFLVTLSAAVQQHRQVFLRYQSWGDQVSERSFDPYGIVFNVGYWYTVGYCHLRRDLRTFRLDRITALEPLVTSFERPEDFDVLTHVLNSIASGQGPAQVEVFLQTSLEHARQIISPVMGTLEPSGEGVIFRRSATGLPWIACTLLVLDFPVKVIQPPELRDLLRRLSNRALEISAD